MIGYVIAAFAVAYKQVRDSSTRKKIGRITDGFDVFVDTLAWPGLIVTLTAEFVGRVILVTFETVVRTGVFVADTVMRQVKNVRKKLSKRKSDSDRITLNTD
jgi:hypothetical protein